MKYIDDNKRPTVLLWKSRGVQRSISVKYFLLILFSHEIIGIDVLVRIAKDWVWFNDHRKSFNVRYPGSPLRKQLAKRDVQGLKLG